ncbi:MAG: ABC transporter ATP-binding protein [Bacillota bacterium]|nr:ABC transporter ATP-binding protein [Bacillota bacterium]
MKNLRVLMETYRYLLKILMQNAPFIVIFVFILSLISGLLAPFSVFVNSEILNAGLEIAAQQKEYATLLPLLGLFLFCALAPNLISMFIWGIAEPRSMLVLRSAFRSEMLQKLKRMKYEHLESEKSMEIIDKAYTRAENSARHLFPMYINMTVQSLVASMGSLLILMSIKWWLIFPILLPFALETILANRSNYNIYVELESYWQREKEYGILQGILQNRDFVRENRLNQASDYLIDTYKNRFNSRNRSYEKFFFKNLRKIFLSSNISRIAILGNALILLILYTKGQMSTGLFVATSLMIFTSLYDQLGGCVFIFKWGHYHANFFNYYGQYFDLSEDLNTESEAKFKSIDIEFKDVWFRYPGTDRDVLKGVSFHIKDGEKVSIVGKNGEGKSTIIKLLLGLFTPDQGEILIGGVPLTNLSLEQKINLFGTVFQDFNRFNLTLRENIVIGDLTHENDGAKLADALKKSKLDETIANLVDKEQTLLGKEFEGGTDLSGGQWQRIAMARALYGDKPILILDEPTSQLDPMAESALYSEFADIVRNKTALFITHRLGSTAITDKIIVISDGVVVQTGTHRELLAQRGLYAEMFESQKSWYNRSDKTS